MEIRFIVKGEPCGKGRPRYRADGQPYTPEKTANYEELVQIEYRVQAGVKRFKKDDLIEMVIFAYYPIPKNTPKWKIDKMIDGTIRPRKKPDWDNVGKVIADSLNGIAYHDDAQIVDGMVRKFYSDEPRTSVILRTAQGVGSEVTQEQIESI